MRRILLSLAPSAVTGAIALVLWLSDGWQRIWVPLGDRNFGDLHVIMLAAPCARTDVFWRAADPPCVEGISHYNYPSLWAQTFGFLGADESWTEPIAALLIVIFLIALIPVTWLAIGASASITRALAMVVVSLTPPVWLGFQRGNTDLAAFAIVVAATLLWLRGMRTTAGAAVAIATIIKIFPIGAGLLLVSKQGFSRRALAVFASLSIVGLLVIAPDLGTIAERTPQIDGASFGVGLLPLVAFNALELPFGFPAARILGLVMLAALTAALYALFRSHNSSTFMRSWRSLVIALSTNIGSQALVLASGGAFLVAYLLGPSFDYRLIFLIPVIAGLLRLRSHTATIAAFLLGLVMLLSYNTFIGATEYIADVLLLIIVPCMLVSAWFLVRQSANEVVPR